MRNNIGRNKRINLFNLNAICCAALIFMSAQHASAVSIAVLDSGVTLESIENPERLLPGFDFVNDDDTPEDDSNNQQGTGVTNVLLGQTSASLVLPLKITQPGAGFTADRGNAALNQILASPEVRVIDHSNLQPTPINILQQAVSSGKVVVISAGDNSLSSPSNLARSVSLMSGGALIVGGVDQNNRLTGSSNAAGDLQDFYLVAPASSPFTTLTGTDVAKSNVAAAAAVLIESAPNLSPQQAVEILLTTATDLGAIGTDNIFGHGLLNLQEALKPQGTPTISGNDSGGSGAGAIVALGVAGAVGYALFKRPDKLQKTLIMDQFERPYIINLLDRTPIKSERSAATLLGFSHHTQKGIQKVQEDYINKTKTRMNISTENDPSELIYDDKQAEQIISLARQTNFGNSKFTNLLNHSISQSFGLTGKATNENVAFIKLNSPYLDLSKRGFGFVVSKTDDFNKISEKSYTLGLAFGDEQSKHKAPTKSVIYQGNINGNRGEIGLQLAYTHEDGALLGGASNGPFSVKSTETISSLVGGTYYLNDKWSLGGSYAIGRTHVKPSKGSLLTQFSTLNSSAAEIKLLGKSIFNPRDNLQISVSQPISFTKGSIGLSVPTSVDTNNLPLFSHQSIQLEGLGAIQTNYEIRYYRPLSRLAGLTTKMIRRESKLAQRSVSGISLIYSHRL